MAMHVPQKQARAFQVFDDLAGGDRVELAAQVHYFDVGTNDVEAHLRQDSHAGRIDIDSDRPRVELEDASEQGICFAMDAGLCLFASGPRIDATQVEHVPLRHESFNDRNAVPDNICEHLVRHHVTVAY